MLHKPERDGHRGDKSRLCRNNFRSHVACLLFWRTVWLEDFAGPVQFLLSETIPLGDNYEYGRRCCTD